MHNPSYSAKDVISLLRELERLDQEDESEEAHIGQEMEGEDEAMEEEGEQEEEYEEEGGEEINLGLGDDIWKAFKEAMDRSGEPDFCENNPDPHLFESIGLQRPLFSSSSITLEIAILEIFNFCSVNKVPFLLILWFCFGLDNTQPILICYQAS